MQRLLINNVTEGKGAAEAGIKKGDVIESYAGVIITNNEELSAALSTTSCGALIVNRPEGSCSFVIKSLPLGINTTVIEIDPENFEASCALDPKERQRFLDEKNDKLISAMVVTTTHKIDGFKVEKYVDVVSAECVFGMNIFSDILASFSDFFGGRSGTSQNALRKARETAIRELKSEALRIGANAVIGVEMDYSELSGQGKSMLFLVATGTAVIVKPESTI